VDEHQRTQRAPGCPDGDLFAGTAGDNAGPEWERPENRESEYCRRHNRRECDPSEFLPDASLARAEARGEAGYAGGPDEGSRVAGCERDRQQRQPAGSGKRPDVD
jgi:hypothetical protein